MPKRVKSLETTLVSIRLPSDLLEWVDSQVDGINIKDRTQFIVKTLSELRNKESKK